MLYNDGAMGGGDEGGFSSSIMLRKLNYGTYSIYTINYNTDFIEQFLFSMKEH